MAAPFFFFFFFYIHFKNPYSLFALSCPMAKNSEVHKKKTSCEDSYIYRSLLGLQANYPEEGEKKKKKEAKMKCTYATVS